MTTDFHALCARMADELDYYSQLLMDNRREVHPLATAARAALAKPQPEPSALKEQALALLQAVETSDDAAASWDFSVIRRALESLPTA